VNVLEYKHFLIIFFLNIIRLQIDTKWFDISKYSNKPSNIAQAKHIDIKPRLSSEKKVVQQLAAIFQN